MRVLIAHGASGSAASMGAHVAGLGARGICALAIDLPLRRAEAAVPAYRAALMADPERPGQVLVAGQSYGGRVASLLAAEADPRIGGLICFSYPLHPPGSPDWRSRTEHWTRLRVPVLLLSGERDPFARIDLLRRAHEERLPAARLVTWPGIGHSLRSVLGEVLDEAAAFVHELADARGP